MKLQLESSVNRWMKSVTEKFLIYQMQLKTIFQERVPSWQEN